MLHRIATIEKNMKTIWPLKSAKMVHKSVNAATVLAALWRPLATKENNNEAKLIDKPWNCILVAYCLGSWRWQICNGSFYYFCIGLRKLKAELWPPHRWFAWERSVLFSSTVCVSCKQLKLPYHCRISERASTVCFDLQQRLLLLHASLDQTISCCCCWCNMQNMNMTTSQPHYHLYLTLSTSSSTCNATQAFVFSKYISYLWPWLPSSWPFSVSIVVCINILLHFVAVAFCFVLFVYYQRIARRFICLQSSSLWCLSQLVAVCWLVQ